MTIKELLKRNDKADHLRVVEVGEGQFYVESSTGKVAYKAMLTEVRVFCTCGDFQINQNNPEHRCKHLLAIEGCLASGGAEKREYLKKRQPKLQPEFIKTIEGKEFVTYQGLLDLAHQKGLLRIEAEILQYPDKDNGHTAVVKAVAESKKGEVFSDLGDANPINCNPKVGKHLLRMASTRAKARCLRDMTNIGMTCLEELGDLNEVIGNENEQGNNQGRKRAPLKAVDNKGTHKTSNPHTGTSANEGTAPATSRATASSSTTSGDQGATQAVNTSASTDSSTQTQPKPPAATTKAKGSNGGNGSDQRQPMSEAQNRAIHNLSRRRGITLDNLKTMAMEMYGLELEHLSSSDASSFIRHLQQAA